MQTTISCFTPSRSCHLYIYHPKMPVLWTQIDNLNVYIIFDINKYCPAKTIIKNNYLLLFDCKECNVYLVPFASLTYQSPEKLSIVVTDWLRLLVTYVVDG